MKNSRLVYSTESGRMCPECGQAVEKCSCTGKKGRNKTQAPPGDGIVRIRRETKGRKGKTVTAVSGVPLDAQDLQHLGKDLRRKCGSGGTVDEGVIYIQGDHRETLFNELKKQGYTVKLAGG